MKLEFLPSGSPDCPLIRLYDFDKAAVIRLREVFRGLADATVTNTPLHEQNAIEAIEGCRLELRVGSRDRGIVQIAPLRFECILTTEGWSEVGDLMEPFYLSETMNGYQWLNTDGEVSLLLSRDGLW